MQKRFCEHCKAEIVYGYAASANNEKKEFICDICFNVLSADHENPPLIYPLNRSGRC
jgi:hypothetical protein